jgi:hypothetical protein
MLVCRFTGIYIGRFLESYKKLQHIEPLKSDKALSLEYSRVDLQTTHKWILNRSAGRSYIYLYLKIMKHA